MKLPDVVLRLPIGGVEYGSCPEIVVDGFRIPKVLRVQTDAPCDEIATVTVTFLAKIRHETRAPVQKPIPPSNTVFREGDLP